MKLVRLNALDVAIRSGEIFSLIKVGNFIHLIRFEPDLENIDELAKFKGSKAFILEINKEGFLVNIDNNLILVDEDNRQRIVLKANRAENFFWHATKAEEKIFVHEYGQPPTSIYASEDLRSWRRVATNIDIDRGSKHFHYITWDPYRKWLMVTLGDGCLTRVAYSEDLGVTWRPFYKGAWQFIPIVPLEDEIVFGMDSGIARGGIGIFNSLENKWKFIFLKWIDNSVKLAQMVDLKKLKNGIWIATLGVPQAIIMSKDLQTWYSLYTESSSVEIGSSMKISESEENDLVVCSTGNSLILFYENELEGLFNTKPIMINYRAFIDRLRGLVFVLKREVQNIIRVS